MGAISSSAPASAPPPIFSTPPVAAMTALIESGFVSIPESAPWLAEYLHEITVFPNGKHDDQVDPTAQFLDWFKRPFRSQGMYELTRIQAEAQQRAYRPEPEKPNWAPGSLEWQAEQEKLEQNSAAESLDDE